MGVDTENIYAVANVSVACSAGFTSATTDVSFSAYTLSNLDSIHCAANLDDFANKFVSYGGV